MSTLRARKRGRRTGSRASEDGTLTERAYGRLEELIVTLQLKPGQFLSEQALADEIGIGRTPIREALQRLAQEGLVLIVPRRGILVSDTDVGRQLLVLEVRRELERLLSRAAARRATPAQKLRLAEIADGMDAAARTNNDIVFMRFDRELNLLILAAAHNEYAARAMRSLQGLSRRFWYLHYKQAADLPECARLHAAQARAVAAGDAANAAKATDQLMDYVESFTRATVATPAGL